MCTKVCLCARSMSLAALGSCQGSDPQQQLVTPVNPVQLLGAVQRYAAAKLWGYTKL